MNELTKRLRHGCVIDCKIDRFGAVDEAKTESLLAEAADEIERLASEVEALKKMERDRWTGWAKDLYEARKYAEKYMVTDGQLAEFREATRGDWSGHPIMNEKNTRHQP